MHELTAYFVTTDRVNAPEALASLDAQGIPRPVVVIRNVRPLYAAHLPTLKCETPYCLVLDDDTVLNPGVAQALTDRFREMRSAQPTAFKLNGRVYNEAHFVWDVAGVKFFYTPLLKRVGWPDATHVSFVQMQWARKLGLTALTCEIEAGVQKRGSNLDVYKKYMWTQIRAVAGEGREPPFQALVRRAHQEPPWLWFAALGVIDGRAVGRISTSKDEQFMGPIGRTLDFDQIQAEDVRRVLAEHGVVEATVPPAPRA